MLARYAMKRGVPASALPTGLRQDTRKHTRHVLRPDAEAVAAYLGGRASWETFADAYRAVVRERFADDRGPFDALAALAREGDVLLGCSCPTKANPDVRRCHTWLALELMAAWYPDLEVRFPATSV
jgi:uncharacterized protein YeaO (DUF488 family)